jgi:hypothetical protein
MKTDMIIKGIAKAALSASLLLGAMSSQALVITGIEMEVRSFDYSAFVEPTTVSEATAQFDAASFVCKTSISSFDNVGSSQSCGGPKTDIATLFTVTSYADEVINWEFGSDYGLVSFIYDSVGGALSTDSSDLWWANDWGNSDVWNFTTYDVGGMVTMNLLGFEHCCGGGMSLRYDDGSG